MQLATTTGLAALIGVAAAVRSTWSPCGLSMLSSITPFGERARGHRYGVTAAWFVAGAVAGGATLGSVVALVALAFSAVGATGHPAVVAAVGGVLALAAAGVDSGAFGPVLPVLRRQVDDAWLSRYRSWAYGSGFGWQIGTGVATYVMTAGVFLMAALLVLGASPAASVSVCAAFGLVRGLAVLLTSRAGTPAELRVLHAALDRARDPVRWAGVAVQVLCAALLFAGVSVAAAAVVVPAGVAVAAARVRPRRTAEVAGR